MRKGRSNQRRESRKKSSRPPSGVPPVDSRPIRDGVLGRIDGYLGIDPGLSGAFAVITGLNKTGGPPFHLVESTPTFWVKKSKGKKRMYDISALVYRLKILCDGHRIVAGLERQQAMPSQGVVSMFSIGVGFGIWQGLLAGLGIDTLIVHPRKWQNRICPGKGDTKVRSIAAAKNLFGPLAVVGDGPRSKKPHDGKADALNICRYMVETVAGVDLGVIIPGAHEERAE